MVDKVFKRFSEAVDGGDAVIGGVKWHARDGLPPGLAHPDRLVVPGLASDADAFRVALGERPLLLEVGPGKGRFANGLAALRPEALVLAAETRLGFCLRTLQRSVKAGTMNLWAAWGDARVTVPVLVPPGRATEAYLLFPDPWWKRAHANRRHGPAMAAVLAAALVPGGRLVVKSDVGEYLEAILDTFRESGRFDPGDVPPDLPLTDREKRLSESGTKTFAAALTRRYD